MKIDNNKRMDKIISKYGLESDITIGFCTLIENPLISQDLKDEVFLRLARGDLRFDRGQQETIKLYWTFASKGVNADFSVFEHLGYRYYTVCTYNSNDELLDIYEWNPYTGRWRYH